MREKIRLMRAAQHIGLVLVLVLISNTVLSKEKTDWDYSLVFMADYDQYDSVFNNNQGSDSDFDVRRAKATLEGKLSKHWGARVQVAYDVDDSKLVETDLYAKFNGEHYDITLGKHKQAYGLDNLTSSSNTVFIERSMALEAFKPGRNYGVTLSSTKNKKAWAIGVYQEDDDQAEGSASFFGRYTFSIGKGSDVMHFGISGAQRDWGGGRYRVNETAEVCSSSTIVDTPTFLVDSLGQYGLEYAWVKNAFSLQSEFFEQSVELLPDNTVDELIYYGGYLQFSYSLTGEHRRYKDGRFRGLRPLSDKGAWEIALRHSMLDAYQNSVGTEAENLTLGVNYYMNRDIRFMLNLINTDVAGDISGDRSGDAMSFRFQYEY